MSKIFAHRGFSGEYPENTMLAFRKAVEAGSDGIELDVHLSQDGEIIVMHDEKIDRTTDGSGYIREYTAEELRRFDAGAAWKGRFPFEPIPTLREYFQLVKDSPLVTNIELKNSIFWYEGMEEKVIALIREFGLEDRIIFSSFNHESIAKCRRLAPEIPGGFLYDCWIIDSGSYAAANGVQYLHPSFHDINEEIVRKVHSQGVGFNVWTVNDEDVMRRLAQLEVHGIITNYPDKCRSVLNSLRGGAG